MPDHPRLEQLLRRIDGRSYPAYRDLKGAWRLDGFVLQVDHVQGDPYAAPSRVRLTVAADIPVQWRGVGPARVAVEDWILRRFSSGLRHARMGSGRSGELQVAAPGPEVVERSAVRVLEDGRAELRFMVGLPARGRSVLGRAAYTLLTEVVLEAGDQVCGIGDDPSLAAHVASVCRQSALRDQLAAAGLVAFVEDGSVLPRASGVDQGPLVGAVPFESPPGLRVSLEGPEGPVQGMGLPRGVCVIVGGGFHGKSTLLGALARGHLDHIPGDGRTGVVAGAHTVKVRAEDGRAVTGVDISAFLGTLPGGQETRAFHTADASGSTSQAAAIAEAIESGARLLLVDEDTSATNLMVQDPRMRALVHPAHEPIVPFVDRVRGLARDLGVSTVVVVGGVADYLGVADTVIRMQDWRAHEATEAARAIVPLADGADLPMPRPAERTIDPQSLRPSGRGRVRARSARALSLGEEEIDLGAVEQVLDAAHARSIGHALRWLADGAGRGCCTVGALLDQLEGALAGEGVDLLSPFAQPVGDLVRPRRHEVAAALGRHRRLRLGAREEAG